MPLKGGLSLPYRLFMKSKNTKYYTFQTLQEMSTLKKVIMMLCFLLISMISVFVLAFHAAFSWFAIISFLLGFIGFFLCFFGIIAFHSSASIASSPKLEVPLPPTPKEKPIQYAPEYKALLEKLKDNINGIQERQNEVEELIDDSFEGSLISSARYKQVMQSAEEILQKNYQNAAQAVSLFGSSKPTAERLTILEGYVHDSDEVTQKIDRVIDELLKLRQSYTFESGDELDKRLEDLADTTVYYR